MLNELILIREINDRGTKLHRALKKILDNLQQATSKKKFPSEIMKYFAVMSGSKGAPPQNYFSFYELSRLDFNYFGLYTDLTGEKTKMIIVLYFLFRVLLVKFFTEPWKYFSEVKESPQLIK